MTETVKRFPLPEPDFSGGCKISLHGVLGRAATACQRSRDSKHLAYSLEQLNEHIEILRASSNDDDAVENLAKFLNLWVKD